MSVLGQLIVLGSGCTGNVLTKQQVCEKFVVVINIVVIFWLL